MFGRYACQGLYAEIILGSAPVDGVVPGSDRITSQVSVNATGQCSTPWGTTMNTPSSMTEEGRLRIANRKLPTVRC